jgi:hypothetical protein
MMVLLAEVVERLLALEETKMASWVARPTIWSEVEMTMIRTRCKKDWE